jgi:hypothetical protein
MYYLSFVFYKWKQVIISYFSGLKRFYEKYI